MIKRSHYNKIKKDYQNKKRHNPFFHKRQEGKYKYIKRGVFVFVVLLVLIYFFLSASIWRWRNIKIEGLTNKVSPKKIIQTIKQQADNKRYLIFKQDNIFLFNTSEAEKNILHSFNFNSVKVTKSWFHTINVSIRERSYLFIFKEKDKMFFGSADAYLDKERTIKSTDFTRYFILENKSNKSLIDNDKININLAYLKFIINLNKYLSQKTSLKVERFILDQEFNTIKVKFKNGPLVYFNIKDNLIRQVKFLLLVKNKKIKDNFKKTNYIDLRYGNKIFINPDFK